MAFMSISRSFFLARQNTPDMISHFFRSLKTIFDAHSQLFTQGRVKRFWKKSIPSKITIYYVQLSFNLIFKNGYKIAYKLGYGRPHIDGYLEIINNYGSFTTWLNIPEQLYAVMTVISTCINFATCSLCRQLQLAHERESPYDLGYELCYEPRHRVMLSLSLPTTTTTTATKTKYAVIDSNGTTI